MTDDEQRQLVDEGIALAQHLPEGTIHRAMASELARLRREAENVRYLEGWLRTNYSRRLGACDSLPDAHLWLESERSRERFCDAPTLAALGALLREQDNTPTGE